MEQFSIIFILFLILWIFIHQGNNLVFVNKKGQEINSRLNKSHFLSELEIIVMNSISINYQSFNAVVTKLTHASLQMRRQFLDDPLLLSITIFHQLFCVIDSSMCIVELGQVNIPSVKVDVTWRSFHFHFLSVRKIHGDEILKTIAWKRHLIHRPREIRRTWLWAKLEKIALFKRLGKSSL